MLDNKTHICTMLMSTPILKLKHLKYLKPYEGLKSYEGS